MSTHNLCLCGEIRKKLTKFFVEKTTALSVAMFRGSSIKGNYDKFREGQVMKYFLRSFSPFRWFKKGSCQFLAKEYAQHWLTA